MLDKRFFCKIKSILAHHEIKQPVRRHDKNLNIVFLHLRTIEFLQYSSSQG